MPRLLEKIADWCDRFTPLVAFDPPHGLVLDITGCAHLFGGEPGAARCARDEDRAPGLSCSAPSPAPRCGTRLRPPRRRPRPPGGEEGRAPSARHRAGSARHRRCAGLSRAGLKRLGDLADRVRRARFVSRYTTLRRSAGPRAMRRIGPRGRCPTAGSSGASPSLSDRMRGLDRAASPAIMLASRP